MRNKPGRYYRVLKLIDYGFILPEKQLTTGYTGISEKGLTKCASGKD